MALDFKPEMSRTASLLAVGLAGLLALVPVGFSADPFSLVRSFNQRVALTNSPIIVTATLTNGGTDTLRGFYFTDQLPSAFSVTTISVALGGQGLTNFTVETGREGDLYPGYTPWRWRLETPIDMSESNAIAPGAEVQIVYSLSSSTNGAFALQPYDWAAYFSDPTNAIFGLAESAYEGTVRFVDSMNLPLISAQSDTNGFSISLDGAPCTSYLLCVSSNLWDWLPLTTNTSPFSFLETNTDFFPQRFYRAVPFP